MAAVAAVAVGGCDDCSMSAIAQRRNSLRHRCVHTVWQGCRRIFAADCWVKYELLGLDPHKYMRLL